MYDISVEQVSKTAGQIFVIYLLIFVRAFYCCLSNLSFTFENKKKSFQSQTKAVRKMTH